ncbi:HMG box-containing protein 4-like [Macrosteles quadrilineatus]|uniref:HMG box-containing protein 4-like n=1 Tax=Macrosteles quadrilineatus TaxID=74068 RepID=UPI0023E1BAD0|nr:HMG box-containing protein 4-like [Macrosteles quadrilineatus]
MEVGSELEVTGVSRSGRVRKKSSKLTDFESLDESERSRKKNEKPEASPTNATPKMSNSQKKSVTIKMEMNSEEDDDVPPTNFAVKEEVPPYSESDSEMGMFQTNDSSLDSLGSEVDDDDMDDQLVLDHQDNAPVTEGFQRINPDSPDTGTPSQAQSLYMLEKSSKKKLIIKDGRIVGRMKAQRKDKGKTRFTAYMLWAKEIRQELMRANPDLDFSQTSKKLGELWATVPYNEKYIWKRKAKRLASKGGKEEKVPTMVVASPKKRSPPARKFINKQSGASASQGTAAATASSDTPVKGGRSTLVAEPVVGPGLYKVIGTQPIDVSAHLRLLGESLTIIGERLKEHEGQIAVSGSLSVLLDSLLCALGPLLCLTQQVPAISSGCSPETLSKILDNIAYIMPGL